MSFTNIVNLQIAWYFCEVWKQGEEKMTRKCVSKDEK